MPRGRKITKTIEIEGCTVGSASEEFYRHNQARGLSEDTQRAYKSYVGLFGRWCGEDMVLCINRVDEFLLTHK